MTRVQEIRARANDCECPCGFAPVTGEDIACMFAENARLDGLVTKLGLRETKLAERVRRLELALGASQETLGHLQDATEYGPLPVDGVIDRVLDGTETDADMAALEGEAT